MGGFLKPDRQLDAATLLERVSKQAEEIAYQRFKLEQKDEKIKSLGLDINVMGDDAHRLRELLTKTLAFVPQSAKGLREDIKDQVEFSDKFHKLF